MKRMLLAFLLLFATPALAQEPLTSPPTAGFADLVEKLSPAVVNISTTQKVKSGGVQLGVPNLPDTPEMAPFREFFDRFGQMQGKPTEREVTSLGSGFIIEPEGFIITNNHVVELAEDIAVTLPDNSKYKAKIIGRDPKTDLALLKVDAKKPLPFVPLGDSDVMRVGDWVIAIGNPFGLGGTVTQGIISARQRSINSGPFDDFLQTDAPINRGNSGGPLFNIKGEVIGINSAIFSPSGGSVGIGFAIPTALAKPVVAQLKEFGRTHRGWLGVKIQEVTEDVAESVGLKKAGGALVLEVAKDGPAAKVGLQAGDIITQFDGRDIAEMRFLPRIVAETKIGKTAPLTFWRHGAYKTVSIKVGELEEDAPEVGGSEKEESKKSQGGSEQLLGLTVAPLSPEFRRQYRVGDKVSGVLVVDVAAGLEAAKRGLRAGDVIAEVSGEATPNIEKLKASLEAVRKLGRANALLKIVRGQDEAFVTLPVSEKK